MRRGAGAWVGAGVAIVFLVLPLVGLAVRAPWGELGSEAAGARSAFLLSAVVSVTATGLSLAGGVPLAWVLARRRFPAKTAVRALVLLPLVLPPVVGGVALLTAYGRRGVAGQWLDRLLGVTLPFSIGGAIVAVTFIVLPFVVLIAEAGFRSVDIRYEELAATLGAAPGRVFWRVGLPLAMPSILAGGVLAWARALGEFGATITFAGNVAGSTRTVPLAVFLDLQSRPDGAIALSLVLVAVATAGLILTRRRWGGQV